MKYEKEYQVYVDEWGMWMAGKNKDMHEPMKTYEEWLESEREKLTSTLDSCNKGFVGVCNKVLAYQTIVYQAQDMVEIIGDILDTAEKSEEHQKIAVTMKEWISRSKKIIQSINLANILSGE